MDRWEHVKFKQRISSAPEGNLLPHFLTALLRERRCFRSFLTRRWQVYPKVLPDEDAASSRVAAHPDRPFQRADDGVHERRYHAPWLHEPLHEPPRTPTHRYGI